MATTELPARPNPPRRDRRDGGVDGGVAASALSASLGPFDDLYDHLRFYVRILRAMPKALRYPREIALLMSDIAIGPGALIVGGGMFFVVMSISFFTGTEVGLEGFTGLSQIGAQAFTGVFCV